jgi:hypothetical protein
MMERQGKERDSLPFSLNETSMTKSHALALALVVSAHAVALAAWDQHLNRLQAGARVAQPAPVMTAPTMTVVASHPAEFR